MKSILFLLKVLLFWLALFFIQRVFFLVYNLNFVIENAVPEAAKSFFYGLRLDLATASYLSFIFFIVMIISFAIPSKAISKWNNYVAFLLILLVLLISLGNTLLYKEWQSLLSKRALAFLLYPKEVMASLSLSYIFIAVLVLALMQYLVFRAWIKFIHLPESEIKSGVVLKIVITLLVPPFLFMGARGGWQLIPVNESAAYFSSRLAINHAAVNPVWYLGSSIWNPVEEENKFHFMNDSIANKVCAELFQCTLDSNKIILKNNRPNIVIIVMESLTADVIGALGGEKGICPNLDSIAEKGILFSHIYGSGSRTDQGLISILSAFPAQPDKSIIKYTAKSNKLPSLYRDLMVQKYKSSFYYGGEVEFANIGAYLRQSGVEKICTKNEFSVNQINSKWGAHDEFVLSKQLQDLSTEKEPFFSVLLTLSNHEPFETPGIPKFKGNDDGTKFRNTAAYTDKCLGNYFREASKTSWYKNTLFILVADHGHRLPQQNDMNMAKSKHIPMLFYGEVLKEKMQGMQCTKIGTQEDIAATLLAQLQLSTQKYTWSKNLFNSTTKDFAYYSNQNVVGWISANDSIAYSFVEKKNIAATQTNEVSLSQAKAYLQNLYAEFLNF
ncbi:MAG: sulfatase-like hydrolase/transferase [Bacteroidetes bacterium]|nr:sulfatase-like hydrolase/transferase [Bacteroidota bacterium]